MKKYFTLMISLVLIFTITVPAFADANTTSEIKFDISPFENSDNYTIEFDNMNDTGEITLIAEDGFAVVSILDNDDGVVCGQLDVKIIENVPPVLRASLFYTGEDWIFTNNVIIKTSNARYTFEASRDTEVSRGKVWEYFTLVFTDESDDHFAKLRLNGSSRDVDGSILFKPELLKVILDDYRASGALDNDFSLIRELCPCKIKQS